MKRGFRVGKWTVDPKLGELQSDQEVLTLKPRQMELLVFMAEHAGEVLPKERLLDRIWKDAFVAENTLMNTISELRKALGDDRADPSFITTHSKRGYRLIAPVTSMESLAEGAAGCERPLRLAVLPFVGRRGGPDSEALAVQLTDRVVTGLASGSKVRVVSQLSILHCRRESMTLPELGRLLDVQRVLEGELDRVDHRLLLTVRLFNELDDGLRGGIFDCEGVWEAPTDTLDDLANRVVVWVEGWVPAENSSVMESREKDEDSKEFS